MTERPVLHGADYSVYVRIAKLTLLEKGVAFDQRPVDIFAAEGPPADYLKLHPFARLPALTQGGFTLYETQAIARYVDEAFAGPALQPTTPRARARMAQIIGIADSYLYRPLVWGLYVAEDDAASGKAPLDAAAHTAAIRASRRALLAIEALAEDGPWLLGHQLTLADLHLASMLAYGCITGAGRNILQETPRLKDWWAQINARPSVMATRFSAELA